MRGVRRRRVSLAAGVASAALVLAATGSAMAASPSPSPPSPRPAPSSSPLSAAASPVIAPVPAPPSHVLPATTGQVVASPPPDTAALSAAVLRALGVTAVGSAVGISVLDVATGKPLVEQAASTSGQTQPALWPTLTGLAIARVNGTLVDRFSLPADALGRGVVRAKTGTLTGVNCLTGVVRTSDGRLLAFAFLGNKSPGPQGIARAALDRAATAVVTG